MEDGWWTVDGGRWTVEDGGKRREKRGGFAGIGRDEGGFCSGYGRFDIEGLNQFFDAAIYIPD